MRIDQPHNPVDISMERIAASIYISRGQKVLLNEDLTRKVAEHGR